MVFVKFQYFCIIYFLLVRFLNGATMDLYKNSRLGNRIVQTRYGRLQGLVLPLDGYKFLKPIEAFLGVPYATPPTKMNRFSPTRTPSPWDGIRIADKFSPVCPQRLPNVNNETAALDKMPKGRLEYLKRLLPFLQNQSEDCLYLNVFAPVHATQSDKKLPVIVFLHGESFEWNSGNPYDGTVLASYSDLVVVTLNYRLGILGFLNANPSPQLRARVANYGLMDQMAALHWVQQNIAKFGGDPATVTLAGHGSGAACINFLMTSPTMVPGLFHRAILLSGSAYSSWALVEDPVVYALKLAKEVNCSIPEDLIKNHEQIVDCLRDVPLEELFGADIQPPSFLSAFGPSVDGVVIRPGRSNQDIDELPVRGTSKRSQGAAGRYDLLFGVVTGEALWRFSAADIQSGFEGDRRDKILRTYVRNAYTYHLSEIFYTVVNEYTDWERTVQHPINMRDAAVSALSDAQFVAPLVHTGDMLAPPPPLPGQEPSGPKCFFYVFDYQTKDGDYPQRMGTVHGEDLPYVFGAPLVDGFNHFPRNYTKSEVALSEAIMVYWANFARTGNPNEHHRQDSVLAASRERNRFRSINWEEYDPVHQKYLEIGMKPRMKNHFRAHQLSIWLRLIPELHKAGMEDVIARHNLFKNHDDMDLYEGLVKPDSFAGRLNYLEDNLKRRVVMTTAEPVLLTTCMPVGNYSALVPTATILNATTDTLAGLEAAGYAAYSTALSVTIAIGCSLLILNVLIFAGVYYQRDKTRLEVKSLQKQYQQRGGGLHQQGPFDPIKHAHYHLGHSQSANVIVDVENHDTGALILAGDVKSPHICTNAMQISVMKSGSPGGVGHGMDGRGNGGNVGSGGGGGGGGVVGSGGGGGDTTSCNVPAPNVTKMPLQQNNTSYGTTKLPPRSEHIAIPIKNSTFIGTGAGTGGGTFVSGMMTLPKPSTQQQQQQHQQQHQQQQQQQHQQVHIPMSYNRNECMTLPRNIGGTGLSANSAGPNADLQQIKLPPNGTAIGIHMRASQTCTSGSPENRPLHTQHSQQQQMAASGHSHHHSHHGQHGQQQQQHQDSLTQLKSQNLKNNVCPPQLPHAAMSEMRV
ncbi:neuroligin-4, Y-linked isoform X2 [Anopheles funestus]|uniref:neuroligin-4, Y-linked isoform X2 n=1 Tax=Anopheles funestus TaxID=62324 RepID=UPI0020C63C21|nr:neuroligin-4, Y-linked isoform X2 [Anopheles funestus]